MPNCVCEHPPAVGLLCFGGWWQDLHSAHCKTLHSTKPTDVNKSENRLHESTSYAAALCRAAHRMTGLGQSLQDPHSLMMGGKALGKLSVSDCRGVWWSDAGVLYTRRRSPWVNLRQSIQVGAWNIPSRREDDPLTYNMSSSI